MSSPRRRRSAAAVAVLALLAALPAAASHLPVLPGGPVVGQSRVQLTAELGRLDPVLEAQGLVENLPEERLYRALTLGGYYRIHRNLKLGAFYRLQWGALHNDDWLGTPAAPDWLWEWRDTSQRLEQLLILDASPRFLLPFLPGRDWVLQLKARYEANLWSSWQSLLLRPELTWFRIVDRRPVFNVSLAYGLYFPLNFGETFVYEHGPYLAFLYHASPAVQLELSAAFPMRVWTTVPDVIPAGESPYQVTRGRLELGFGLLFRLGG
jgi:hypothetical protein